MLKAQTFSATGYTRLQDIPANDWGGSEITFDKVPGAKLIIDGKGHALWQPSDVRLNWGYIETYDPDRSNGDVLISWEAIGDEAEKIYNRVWVESQNNARIKVRYIAGLIYLENEDTYGRRIAHSSFWSGSPWGPQYLESHPDPEATGWGYGDWAEEVYYIYPDGSHTRYAKAYSAFAHLARAFDSSRRPEEGDYQFEFMEAAFSVPFGKRPNTTVNPNSSVLLADMRNNSTYIGYEPVNPGLGDLLNGFGSLRYGNMMAVDMLNSDHNPYVIGIPDSSEMRPYECFTGPANGNQPCTTFYMWGFPCEQGCGVPLGHLVNWKQYEKQQANQSTNTPGFVSNVYLQGWISDATTGTEFSQIGKSWITPAPMSITSTGFSGGNYETTERAYKVLRNSGTTFTCSLQGSNTNPIRNPAIIIENWGNSAANVTVDGARPADLRTGFEGNNLVVWFEHSSESTTVVQISAASNTNVASDILSFNLANQIGNSTINNATHAVDVLVTPQTDLKSLSPSISVSSGASISPASGEAQDFTGPVTYTVTGDDGATKQLWTVTVSNASTETDIISVNLEQSENTTIDATNHTISFAVPMGTDVTSLSPSISVSAGATVSPASGISQDFSNPVTYTVTAEDGSTIQHWTVSANQFTLNNETDILAFGFREQTGDPVIDPTNHTVAVEVVQGSNVTSLIPAITVSREATVSPDGGLAQDFTNPVTYTVTAQDGSIQNWIITVTQGPANNETDITEITISQQIGDATIDAMNHTVSVTIEQGRDLTALVPLITTSTGATISPESAVTQNFTNPVVYTVTAQDESTKQDWTVSVAYGSSGGNNGNNNGGTNQGSGNLAAYYTRTSFEEYTEQISGEYADIVVKVGDLGQLVFSREYSFRPNWVYSGGSERVNHLATINGDGSAEGNFDARCRYAYARIIKNTDSEVIVHWRYFPDLNSLDPTSVVHELYYINTNGSVRREYKAGTAKVDEWLDPANKTTQTFELTSTGISNAQTVTGTFTPQAAIESNPKLAVIGSPVAHWSFDEAVGDKTEPGGTINGHKSLWKRGVSGSALGFDGYFSSVNVPSAQAPTLGSSFTIDTWVVMGAFPFGDAPIVHHSTGNGQTGYYLGLNEGGQAIFVVNGTQVTSTSSLPLNQWVHVVGTYGGGSIDIYIDGVQAATATATGTPAKPSGALVIGLNNQQNSPTDPVFEPQTYPSVFGIEGLIDEVIFYNSKLSQTEVTQSFNRLTDTAIKGNPDINKRILPGQPGAASSFGATHSRLTYHDLWDNMWRASEFEDVTIKFEDLPTSYVYWRGTTHGINMITENNLWMSDQSEEIFCGEKGFPPPASGNLSLSEHMSDKEARYSHVRVIENTPARVVVHWRYGVTDIFFDQCDNRNYVDEYHTIYPDGTLYRTLKFYGNGSTTVPSDLQPLTSPGLLYSDIVNPDALSVTNLDGTSKTLNWSNGIPEGENEILMANFKSNWKIYEAFQLGNTGGPWGAENQSARSTAPYAGPWNHWPVSRVVSDGRQAWDGDGRLHHFALSTGGGGSSMMYGFSNQGSITTQDPNTVIPAVTGWRNGAGVSGVTGATSQGYNLDRREYNLIRSGTQIKFTLDGTSSNPVYNPCFVIKNWNSDAASSLQINGVLASNFKQGVIYDTDGTQTLIIYVPIEATSATNFTVDQAQHTGTDIVSFSLNEQTGSAVIDAINHSVGIEVVDGTDVTSLMPAISVSTGATISPASGAAQDFTNPVNYKVTAEDGTTTQDWIVSVTLVSQSNGTDILSFSLAEQTGAATIDASNHTVEISVLNGTDVTSLVPTIAVSNGATVSPTSGTAQNFTSPVIYKVTARDGSTQQDWTVTVRQASQSTETNIVSFSLTEQIEEAFIDAENHLVTIEVEAATDVTALTPIIVMSPGATVSPASGATQDFTNPVMYTVTAQDGVTKQSWEVAVFAEELPLSSEKELQWKIYPNPTTNILHIQTENPVKVTLTDLIGRILIDHKEGSDIELDLSGIHPGMYILIIQEGVELNFRKIMKSNSH